MAHMPRRISPMLATLVAEPFHLPGWTYEEKYDGDRMLAFKREGRAKLYSRNGRDRTRDFPEIASAIAALPGNELILDGEVAVFDRRGVSHFQALQQAEGRPVYAIFDCLFHDGRDLRQRALSERQDVLQKVIRPGASLRLTRRLKANGLAAFRQAQDAAFEGMVAKDLSSPYVAGRSASWRKVKIHREDEFIVLGYTRPAGQRRYFGALLLGAHDKGRLRYVGRVGTGFNVKTLASLYARFAPLRTPDCPFAEPPPGRNIVYLKPRLVAQISYQELTDAGFLRQPVYLGLRQDKAARDVILPLPERGAS
jgi:bifunctional non-homologous end joining protein LigD